MVSSRRGGGASSSSVDSPLARPSPLSLSSSSSLARGRHGTAVGAVTTTPRTITTTRTSHRHLLALLVVLLVALFQLETYSPVVSVKGGILTLKQQQQQQQNETGRRSSSDTSAIGVSIGSSIPVVVFPYLRDKNSTGGEMVKIILDGLNESPWLHMAQSMYKSSSRSSSSNNNNNNNTNNENDDDDDSRTVWLADVHSGHYGKWCLALRQWVQQAIQQQRLKNGNNNNNNNNNSSAPASSSSSWPLYIIDYGDSPATRTRCAGIEELLGRHYVQYIKRSIVKGRHFNGTWVSPGQVVTTYKNGATYRYASYAVRTDVVQALQEVLAERHALALHDDIETIVSTRTLDLVHLWETGKKTKVVAYKSALRSLVNKIVTRVGKQHNLTTFVGIRGQAKKAGRRRVSTEYIETLLDAKILVVSQRDAWIDHYRLFEAMVGGCMVMTDELIIKPPGIVNGTHLIEYSSAMELADLALYYATHDAERIAIARQGRAMAMSQHRTWHRVEEIIFGAPRTNCSLPGSSPHCPFTVHAVEAG